MTRDIRTTRDRLGLTTAQLARLVGVQNRTAHRWLAKVQDVPEPVWRLLELHEKYPVGEVREALTVEPDNGHAFMADGICSKCGARDQSGVEDCPVG